MGKGVPKPKLQPPAAVDTLRDPVTKTRTGITSNSPRKAAMTAEERRKSLNEGRMDKQEWEKTESQVSGEPDTSYKSIKEFSPSPRRSSSGRIII